MGSFWTNYILFELKKYRGVISHDIKAWCKIWKKTDLLLGKWHEEFGKFSPEHSKVSKLELWWDPFAQSRKCMTLKFTEELCVMTMKNDTKIEEELTCCFKIDMRNFTNFDPNTRKSKKIDLIGSLWPKYLLFEPQKYRGVIFHDTEDLCTFGENLTCGLIKDLRNLANSHQSAWQCQNWDFGEILLSKVEKVWP